MAQQDHYMALGVRRSASKEEIKTAYRKSALEHHPDRHAQSSAAVRESAAVKFRRASEAYETLIDERRRSAYDSGLRTGGFGGGNGSGTYSRTSNPAGGSSSGSYASGSWSYTWTSSSGASSSAGRSWSWSWSSGPTGAGGRGSGGGGGAGSNGGYHYAGDGSGRSETGWQFLSRVMTTRRFLIGVGCVSVLVGSTLLIENAIERAWKRNNSGKSFEEALEALEKARIEKDRVQYTCKFDFDSMIMIKKHHLVEVGEYHGYSVLHALSFDLIYTDRRNGNSIQCRPSSRNLGPTEMYLLV